MRLESVCLCLWEVRLVAEFYRLPHWMLTALVMVIAVCIVLQTRAITYSIRRLRISWMY